MRHMASALAILLALASGQALAADGTIARFCNTEWGTSTPLVQSCIDAQEAAAGKMDALLSEAATRGWREDVERQCELVKKTDYVTAWQCVAGAVNGRKWEQRDRDMARADAWQRPDGVPEKVFVQVKAQCIADFGLKYSTVEICIDHSTREFRS